MLPLLPEPATGRVVAGTQEIPFDYCHITGFLIERLQGVPLQRQDRVVAISPQCGTAPPAFLGARP